MVAGRKLGQRQRAPATTNNSPGPTNRKKTKPRIDPDQKKIALGISVGSAPAPLPAGSVHSRIRPRCRRCPPILRAESKVGGGVEAVRGCPSPPGPRTPSPRSASIRSRRTSRAARPDRLPRGRRRRKAAGPLPRGRRTNSPDPGARRSESVLSWRGDSSRGDGGDHLDFCINQRSSARRDRAQISLERLQASASSSIFITIS